MSEITYNYEAIAANVKDYRGHTDFIHSIRVKMSATDGVHKVFIEKDYEVDVSREFTDENPFVPFNEWDAQRVYALVDELTTKANTRSMLDRQLKIQTSKPQLKSFNI